MISKNDKGMKCRYTFKGKIPLRCIAVLDNDRIASASINNSIQIWDMFTHKEDYSLTGHDDTINCLLYLKNNRLVSCSSDMTIRFWDLKKKMFDFSLQAHTEEIYSVIEINEDIINKGPKPNNTLSQKNTKDSTKIDSELLRIKA